MCIMCTQLNSCTSISHNIKTTHLKPELRCLCHVAQVRRMAQSYHRPTPCGILTTCCSDRDHSNCSKCILPSTSLKKIHPPSASHTQSTRTSFLCCSDFINTNSSSTFINFNSSSSMPMFEKLKIQHS